MVHFNWNGKYAAQKDDKDYDFSDLSALNEQEKTYVVAYLNNAYRTVNNSLRGTEPNADGDLLATKISSAIKNKIKAMKAIESTIAFNGMAMTRAEIEHKSQELFDNQVENFKLLIGAN